MSNGELIHSFVKSCLVGGLALGAIAAIYAAPKVIGIIVGSIIVAFFIGLFIRTIVKDFL